MKRSAFTVASLIAALACGSESAGPTTGSLEVTAATTGSEPDLDGYTVAIDGSAGEPLAVDGTVTFAQLGTGNHAVRLSGVATHCTVGGENPRTVSVTAGAAAHTTFQIACAALSGSLQVTAATTGTDFDPDGYTVAVDGGAGEVLASNGSVTISGLFAGDHTVALGGVAANCTVSGPNPRPVSVIAGAAAQTAFPVTCAAFGAIRVTAATSGADLDADGYTVAVDGGAGQALAINGSVTFSQLLAGDHTVVLSGVAANCRLSGENPATLTVTSGATAQVAFQMACARIPTTLTFAMVRAGEDNTCGLVVEGAAYCWGWRQPSAVPAYVSGGLTFASIDAGGLSTCGVASDRAAYCWGANGAGQLGNGSTTDSPIPTAVAGGLLIDSVDAGGLHACALIAGGAAYCWGHNYYGQLGNGSAAGPELCNSFFNTYPCSTVPVPVPGGLTFEALSAGGYHTCGLASGGVAYCWGANDYGQLGVGSTTGPEQCGGRPCSTVPVAVTGGHTFTSLSAGALHTCGVTDTGAAYCWGRNDRGQLGNDPGPETCVGDGSPSYPSYYCSTAPLLVRGGLTFKAVSGGGFHTCGVTLSGAAFCWGAGDWGQLGAGDFGGSTVPVAVAGGHAFASLSAAANHSCGLDIGSVAYCWGRNDTGGLGDGSGVSSAVPVKVAGQP
ncbi:MAG: hypothetical protein AUH78_20520 [Gemmatimonadetes bacterium 13_1_40CM_4_69_8]|uniref:Chromosome condensation regulator RCC1 n=1 Tax=Candidatus Segetimicrobium genomatis TaxID=2569760 RepID=A0A537IRI5_9BACT|nr:MAG: hypothetical protein AUH78_20520 [Gemmatimonadetes bacterium 13_1_40CM_4_69_8]TMI73919.1 MAG: hypothetical protein E6H05_08665 [Terrabacteria group bacterium ANGP1]